MCSIITQACQHTIGAGECVVRACRLGGSAKSLCNMLRMAVVSTARHL
jgi:hypothetical protein